MGSFEAAGSSLGPYRGPFFIRRHRSHQDRQRLDFRALAVKKLGIEQADDVSNSKVSIAYFKRYVKDEGFDVTFLELHFADDEDERGVDVVDVLSATFPKDPNPMVGSPNLYRFRGVGKDLPKQTRFLYELCIPYSKLFGLVKLLLLVQ